MNLATTGARSNARVADTRKPTSSDTGLARLAPPGTEVSLVLQLESRSCFKGDAHGRAAVHLPYHPSESPHRHRNGCGKPSCLVVDETHDPMLALRPDARNVGPRNVC